MQTILANSSLLRDTNNRTAIKISGRGSDGGGLDGGAMHSPLKLFNMKNIGTKSNNMSEIMVYLAMFSTTIDKILCFWVLIR